MPVMGVIDDRVEERGVLVDALELALDKLGWEIISSDPLPSLQEYASWLGERDISVLIVDERLNESGLSDSRSVDYLGHDLVTHLRRKMSTLPIFVVTSYPEDPSLIEKFGEVEDIIDRKRFPRFADRYATRFARASDRYTEAVQQDLSKLAVVAQKLATGEATSDDEVTEARAIQQRMEVAFSVDEISDRHRWIQEVEMMTRDISAFQQEVTVLLTKAVSNEMEEDS